MKKTVYEDCCEVECIDNGNIVVADVLEFYPEDYLSVSLNKSIKIVMEYNRRHQHYIGNAAGLEFSSKGPYGYNVTYNRKK